MELCQWTAGIELFKPQNNKMYAEALTMAGSEDAEPSPPTCMSDGTNRESIHFFGRDTARRTGLATVKLA